MSRINGRYAWRGGIITSLLHLHVFWTFGEPFRHRVYLCHVTRALNALTMREETRIICLHWFYSMRIPLYL